MKLEKSASWKKLRCIASHSFWAWLRCASLFWAELGCFCIVLRLTVLHCVESPIRFFLRLPVLLYSDLRSHDALRFSSYSMLVCMTDLKLLRYLRLCFVLTWWPGTEPWREMAVEGDLLPKCSRTLPLRSNGSVTPCGGGRVPPRKHLWRTAWLHPPPLLA